MTGYWYLATPYALYPEGKQAAYEAARDETAKLLLAGIPVYSPVVHCHPLLPKMSDKVGDFDFWLKMVDQPLMHGAGGLLVCVLPSWEISAGIKYEVEVFKTHKKPIYIYTPPNIPRSLPVLTISLDTIQFSAHPLNLLAHRCREANDTWWQDPLTGNPIQRNKGELIALIHSEISEALEGLRKNLPDDHLPQFPMELVELADALVRIFDYVGEYYPASKNDNGINLGNAFEQKMAYNSQRKDHKPENRIQADGKKF